MNTRTFIILENGKEIIRHDVKFNSNDNIELNIFQFLKRLDKQKNIISLKKLNNIIKSYYGLNLSDIVNFFSDNKNWKILKNNENWKKFVNMKKDE